MARSSGTGAKTSKELRFLVPWNLAFPHKETGVISPKAAMFSVGKSLEIPAFPSCITA